MDQHRFTTTIEHFEDGLSFDQIATFAQKHWKLVLGGALLGAAIGIGVSLTLHKEWVASNVVQVGQVMRAGMVNSGNANGMAELIEPPASTVERLMLPQFQDGVLRMLGLPLDRAANRTTALVRDYVNISLLRGTELISISARGFTEDEARRIVETYEARLFDEHKVRLQPSLNRYSSDLAQAKAALTLLEQRREQLGSLISKRPAGDGKNFSENVLLNNMVQTNDEDIRKLQTHIEELQESLDPSRTFNTRAINAVRVDDKPAFPRKSVFGGIGALIGLVGAACLGLLRDRRIARRSQSAK